MGRCETEWEIFKNEQFGEVRTMSINGEPWFVGKDVAEVLGYSNTPKAIRDHVDEDDKLTERIVLSGQNREAVVINESRLYSLILSSKLPQAKEFKHWITHDVIPTIRRHRAYMTETTLENCLNDPDFSIGLLTARKKEEISVSHNKDYRKSPHFF